MNWLRRFESSGPKPFYFYHWREGRYVLELERRFQRRQDAQAEGRRLAARLGQNHHLHILDHNHCLVETLVAQPAAGADSSQAVQPAQAERA